jgi:hypothetical protein
VIISTRLVELVIDTVVCLTLAKWEAVSGQFGGYLNEIKLARLAQLPIFIGRLSAVDPRRESEEPYRVALAISLRELQDDGNTVLTPLQEKGFAGLDNLKQQGLYAGVARGSFVAPREAIAKEYAEAVSRFAWRAITTIDFVLKRGNLERYIEQARSIRSKLAESDHGAFEMKGQRIAEVLFGSDEVSDEPQGNTSTEPLKKN